MKKYIKSLNNFIDKFWSSVCVLTSFGWFLTTVKGALPLFVGWGPAEGSDGRSDLVPVDFALAFVIEEFPVVFPLFDLIATELVCHLTCCAGNY